MFPIGAILDIGSKLIDRFFPDPEQKAKAQLDLLKMQQDGELAKMANDTELAKIYTADLDSARKRESEIAVSDKAPFLNKIITPLLAIVVLTATFALFAFVLFFDFRLMAPFRIASALSAAKSLRISEVAITPWALIVFFLFTYIHLFILICFVLFSCR